MAFNKVSMVLLLLLVVATTLADARLDQFAVSSQSETEELCIACECTEISGTTTCNRTDRKVGGCPSSCSSSCPCTKSIPPICWCTYEVETCSSEQCPESTAANKRENLLTLKGNY
ncbi:hypothetical protein TIFTF001_023866 [Ficus carica]|uniref:Uncharacterized protein n=1 Tax=Ficus carica TaxID=3494 RepID=A0AA88AL77_FICCA|nr:hypothetical protein TIFTF001_023866 [Ficus carica]